jgi:hypothetical protein
MSFAEEAASLRFAASPSAGEANNSGNSRSVNAHPQQNHQASVFKEFLVRFFVLANARMRADWLLDEQNWRFRRSKNRRMPLCD